MSQGNILDKVKKLREATGVGFKDCKNAIDENDGDVEKSIEFLRKKGIVKANKRMERIAAEGLVCVNEKDNKFSIIEINSETDFVAKNQEFINFTEEVANLTLINSAIMKNILTAKMKNKKNVEENLVSLIAKIGEKITIRRIDFLESEGLVNFSYIHSPLKKNVGKIGVLLSLKTVIKKKMLENFGKSLAMHIAASSPLTIDREGLDQKVLNKENEIITEELKNSGKDEKIISKIATGKLNKFISDNTLLNQEWIMDPKKKVKDILKENSGKDLIEIKKFVRFKVGEGIQL
jgi:elongation factor Ts